VCVLGDKVKVSLLGYGPGAAGKYIKVNDTWLEVVGVLAPMVGSGIKAGAQAEDRNNFITFRSTPISIGSGTAARS
jgi:putative ABC transport system permease protein